MYSNALFSYSSNCNNHAINRERQKFKRVLVNEVTAFFHCGAVHNLEITGNLHKLMLRKATGNELNIFHFYCFVT